MPFSYHNVHPQLMRITKGAGSLLLYVGYDLTHLDINKLEKWMLGASKELIVGTIAKIRPCRTFDSIIARLKLGL